MTFSSHAFRVTCRNLSKLSRQKIQVQLVQTRCYLCTNDIQHRILSSPLTHNNGQLDFRIQQTRCMSDGRRSFLKNWLDNVKEDFTKSKEMKENLKKFREEREKLEQAEALQKARQKFENIQAETSQGFKKTVDDVKEKISEGVEEVSKTEFAKKAGEFTSEIGKSAGKAAESIAKSGQQIGQSATFKTITEGVKSVKEEFDESTIKARAKHYKAPETLRKRSDKSTQLHMKETVEADDESTGMVLHKDSKWYQSWQNFKENNQYVNKLFDLKMKYDESDNVAVRGARFVTDKISSLFGGVFSKTEMSEVLTEICKVDPNFDKEDFVKFCQFEIIPNILEAMNRGDLDVLKDWCYEAVFNTLADPIKKTKLGGYINDSKVLDISNLDVVAAQMMEHGPVLVISFQAQQILVVKDKSGLVKEGDPDKIMRMTYIWALCRDQEELNPEAAWKLIDISAMPSEQFL